MVGNCWFAVRNEECEKDTEKVCAKDVDMRNGKRPLSCRARQVYLGTYAKADAQHCMSARICFRAHQPMIKAMRCHASPAQSGGQSVALAVQPLRHMLCRLAVQYSL
eukprot:1161814-Pelagomonas_calceolata.AAC.3